MTKGRIRVDMIAKFRIMYEEKEIETKRNNELGHNHHYRCDNRIDCMRSGSIKLSTKANLYTLHIVE